MTGAGDQDREPAGRFRVSGLVRRSNGSPAAAVVVRAFDVDFRSEELLGKAATDATGAYAIVYDSGKFRRTEKRSADLVVRAFARGGREALAESRVVFNAPVEAVVNLAIEAARDSGPSEYDTVFATATALAGRVSPAEFTEKDLRFLAGETGLPGHRLLLLAVAHRHARRVPAPAEALYGLMRQGLPTGLAALLITPPRRMRQALEKSLQERVVPGKLKSQLGAILDALAKARAEHALGSEPGGKPAAAADLLVASGVPAKGLEKFLDLYLKREGSLEDFWTSLRKGTALPKEHVESLELALRLGRLTGGNAPLVRALKKKAKTLEDLADLSLADWEALVDGTRNGSLPLPPGLPGRTEKERITYYAGRMRAALEESIPMAFVRKGAAKDATIPAGLRRDLTHFFDGAPDFHFANVHVETYLSRNPGALTSVQDTAALKHRLKSMQRVFQVTPRYEQMQALLEKGYHSAFAIAGGSLPAFLNDMGAALGADAEPVYYKASQKSAAATQAAALAQQYVWGTMPQAVGPKPDPKKLPAWTELFGSLDLCECEHCRSVYGPAAYLVDLLQYLRRSGATAYNALKKRRPDLEHLKLTCENTNTPLPYVDLVNEILEFYVVHGDAAEWPANQAQALAQEMAKDTGDAAAEDLAVNPEYTEAAAYEKLRDAAFTFRLPFDLSLETVRAYLDHLGASRHEVMATFQNSGAQTPGSLDLSREYLRLSPQEQDIVAGNGFVTEPWKLFGYATDQVGAWKHDLEKVPNFLRRTGVDYPDLVALLRTRFINPGQDSSPLPDDTLVLSSPGSVSDLEQTTLRHLQAPAALSDDEWRKLHRFLRLWKKLGWTIPELDRAMTALGAVDIDSSFVETLARLAELRAELDEPVDRLLAFWALIDTRGADSLYIRLFQNKAVTNPVDPAFALDAAGTQLADTTALISEHTAALQAALRLNAADLTLLLEDAGLAGETLSLARVSALYRRTLLAKSLRLRVQDFLALSGLSGQDLFASPAATVAFVKRARRAQTSAFSAADLNYLFRHLSAPVGGPAPAMDRALILLQSLAADLKKIIAETEPAPDPDGNLLRGGLAQVLPEGAADQAMEIIDGVSGLPLTDREQFIDDHFAAFLDPAEAKTELLGPGDPDPEAEKEANRAYVHGKLLPFLRATLSRGLVKQTLATTLSLEAALAQSLLEDILPARTAPGHTAMADFLSLTEAATAPEDRLPDYIRLHKIAKLIAGWNATPAEMKHLAAHGADFGGFDLNAVPLDRTDVAAVDAAAPGLFFAWETAQDFFHLRDAVPSGDHSLLDVVAAPSAAEARAALANLAGWEAADVEFLAGPLGLGLPDDSFKNAEGPGRLKAAFSLARRVGTSVQQLRQWAVTPPDDNQSQAVVQTTKAKYDEETWPAAARPVNDGLRELRKQALIAYVLSDEDIVTKKLDDADRLLEFFLIDVSMSPCMMTSRVKQALSSVQLFIQRCLMNLESSVPPQLLDARRWEWMRNYRVWEANRKVFLYPENWIEPGLRDDKSPFFKELEGKLLQSELTGEAAEAALMDYLLKVESVSGLEICALYHEKEGSGKDRADRVHIFGRTRVSPRLHYHRSWNAATGAWTAWEKLSVDVDGDLLMPVTYNRRLYLFWPVFTEKSSPWREEDFPNFKPESPQVGHWEIRLAWSELKNGRWSPKNVSRESIVSHSHQYHPLSWLIDYEVRLPDSDKHSLRAVFADGKLEVHVLRKVQEAWSSLPFYQRIGTFILGACGNRVDTPQSDDYQTVDIQAYGRYQPEYSHPFEMSFEFYVAHLILVDRKGTDEPVTLLEDMPFEQSRRMVPPPQPSHMEGSRWFSFAVQDGRGTYLVTRDHEKSALTSPSWASAGFAVQDDLHLSYDAPQKIFTAQKQVGGGSFAQSALSQALVNAGSSLSEGPPMMAMQSSGGSGSQTAQASPQVMGEAAAEAMILSKLTHRFRILFHPHLCAFLNAANRGGLPALLTLANQKLTNDPAFGTLFEQSYDPTEVVHTTHPREHVDFDGGAYSLYNWELFFHAPLLIADALRREQKFPEALGWFHYIFNPTASQADGPTPERYWRLLPFQKTDPERLEDMMTKLSAGSSADKQDMIQQVEAWRSDPFNPHLIARFRLSAYMKTVVMKYIQTLLAWGDQLFARDTLESINEATHLYVLAQNLLGERPRQIPPRGEIEAKTYAQLRPDLDAFSNALVQLENEIPFASEDSTAVDDPAPGLGFAETFYFCIPPNDSLLALWDQVEDRLFKIRHCMNIEGIERQLALFEPPIDPALLVKARAAGLDVGSVLSDLFAPLLPYRFNVLVHKALELCAGAKSLGGMLLTTLEKQDAEALANLRARHEVEALERVRDIRKLQIDEARRTLEGLQRSREVTEARELFYRNVPHRIEQETLQIEEMESAHKRNEDGQSDEETASDITTYLPDFSAGGSTTGPYAGATVGRGNVVSYFQGLASRHRFAASGHTHQASLASLEGGWARRADDWELQRNLAARELKQIDKQIAAAEVRLAMAGKELENHITQTDNARAVETFMRDKYTNEELYGWMLSQVSAVYFQAYKLAYDAGTRAEKAFRFERGLADSSYVQFGYWDSLKKGLLSADKLEMDLRRMDMAYLETNRREFEIAKTVSLQQLDPLALITLKETGACEVELPEALFDMDYPGHYLRRIKTVRVTLPCVVGPYAGVNCTLTLLSSKARVTPSAQGAYAEDTAIDDPRFSRHFGTIQSIVTSSGQSDAGLFDAGLRDERYLPFENAGALSRWRIELSRDTNTFDVDTLTDLLLHLQYTARDGGGLLEQKALAATVLASPQEDLLRLFSARHEFPDAWHRFLHPAEGDTVHTLELDLAQDRFPLLYRNKDIEINEVRVFLKLKAGVEYEGGNDLGFALAQDGASSFPGGALVPHPVLHLPHAQAFDEGQESPGSWLLTVSEAGLQGVHPALRDKVVIQSVDRWRLSRHAIQDIWILCRYTALTPGE